MFTKTNRNKSRKLGLLICSSFILPIFILTACKELTPLEKLKSNNVYDDIDNSFWSKEYNNKTTLWAQAVSYCEENEEKPNCHSVMLVKILNNGAITAPAVGHSGNYLTTP